MSRHLTSATGTNCACRVRPWLTASACQQDTLLRVCAELAAELHLLSATALMTVGWDLSIHIYLHMEISSYYATWYAGDGKAHILCRMELNQPGGLLRAG